MRDVLADLDSWTDGARVALATVVDVKRSAPRPPGSKMAINERGDAEIVAVRHGRSGGRLRDASGRIHAVG